MKHILYEAEGDIKTGSCLAPAQRSAEICCVEIHHTRVPKFTTKL